MEVPSCPACRARFEKYHDPVTGRAISHSPIGYAKLFIASATQPVICRSYTDVRSHILQLADGETFHLEIVAFMATVGTGYYTRLGPGVAVLLEDGIAGGFSLALREAIPMESPTLQIP
jgi:hypothetical protein